MICYSFPLLSNEYLKCYLFLKCSNLLRLLRYSNFYLVCGRDLTLEVNTTELYRCLASEHWLNATHLMACFF